MSRSLTEGLQSWNMKVDNTASDHTLKDVYHLYYLFIVCVYMTYELNVVFVGAV